MDVDLVLTIIGRVQKILIRLKDMVMRTKKPKKEEDDS